MSRRFFRTHLLEKPLAEGDVKLGGGRGRSMAASEGVGRQTLLTTSWGLCSPESALDAGARAHRDEHAKVTGSDAFFAQQ